MSGVAHLLKTLGELQPVSGDMSFDSVAAVEEIVQATVAEDVVATPSKKAKTTTETERADWENLDVSTLVPHYAVAGDVPEHLKKCEFFLLPLR